MIVDFAPEGCASVPIDVLTPDGLGDFRASLAERDAAQLDARGFEASLGEVVVLIDADGAVSGVVAGWGTPQSRLRQILPLGGLSAKLPAGTYALSGTVPPEALRPIALGWLMTSYRFERYKTQKAPQARLVAPTGLNCDRILREARANALTADLINTPANDMGPDALEAAAVALGERAGADIRVTRGADLLAQNFPMIHAVGRAAAQEPRLIDMTWGPKDAPKVTLVGKGVCFDTGGLNLKPGGSMGLMKKDMGGAATVLGLAQMLIEKAPRIRVRVLIPAVENAVSASSFRPGDILTARNGLTVEINNTDAEGRLVLADALALADQEAPALTISMATLTGAARVAMGPDIPPFFTDDDELALGLQASARQVADPLWRLPFWNGYEEMIEPGIADLDNAPKGGFAGAITAALFLRRFVAQADAYLHVDCFGWTPSAKPGRPKGGTAQGARAIYDMLLQRFGA